MPEVQAGRLLRHRLPPHPPARGERFPCPAPSSTKASSATASTACPTNTWRVSCRICSASAPAARIVIAHLGNGASMCALRDGLSRDTSMGFTAVDGLMMGTRTGSLDPGVMLT
jgi:hypothetical protein